MFVDLNGFAWVAPSKKYLAVVCQESFELTSGKFSECTITSLYFAAYLTVCQVESVC